MKSTLFPDGVLKMCFLSINQAVFPDGNIKLLVLECIRGEVYGFIAGRVLESDAQGMQMQALFTI